MKSWNQLTKSARNAPAPADLDLRTAIRALIPSAPSTPPPPPQDSLLDALLALFHLRWIQLGMAGLAALAFLSCRVGFDFVHELSLLCQLQANI